MTNTQYIVVKSPYQPKAWAILNTLTNTIEEAGFSSSHAAWEYIWREYTR